MHSTTILFIDKKRGHKYRDQCRSAVVVCQRIVRNMSIQFWDWHAGMDYDCVLMNVKLKVDTYTVVGI